MKEGWQAWVAVGAGAVAYIGRSNGPRPLTEDVRTLVMLVLIGALFWLGSSASNTVKAEVQCHLITGAFAVFYFGRPNGPFPLPENVWLFSMSVVVGVLFWLYGEYLLGSNSENDVSENDVDDGDF
jgi:hypothetical protein